MSNALLQQLMAASTQLGQIDPMFVAPPDPDHGFWFPGQHSTVAADVDWVYFFILWLSVFFFVVIVACMLIFAYIYRRREGHAVEHSSHHNTPLEVTWSVLPGILLVFIFYWGFTGYMDMRTPPPNPYEIQVTAKKWDWTFSYPNGEPSPTLHVPVNTPVELTMTSTDVIHSLFIPAFRVKMDVVPGRYNKMWFEATQTGTYQLYCTEYCGTKHSDMLSTVVVHEQAEFDAWLDDLANIVKRLPPVEAGEYLFRTRGCTQCHNVTPEGASNPQCPNIFGMFGETHAMADGQQVLVDENYIRESILQPNAKVRAGFRPVMSSYQGLLRDEEISAIIAYIKSLK